MADDNKETTMSIKIDRNRMFGLLGHYGEHWLKGAWETDGGAMCLHGAIRRCQPQPGDAFLIEQVAERQGWGTTWNDDSATTWNQVAARIEQIEVSDADLAATFGPQWEPVVAFVRRCAVLTVDEATRLSAAWKAKRQDAARGAAWGAASDAAWDAAWDAAREAVWGAAWGAARDAARDAAREAVWDAAWEAVWDAAWGAAWALAIRDLIGQHGFTQAHYDLLTYPWATLIGKAHPDDEEADRG